MERAIVVNSPVCLRFRKTLGFELDVSRRSARGFGPLCPAARAVKKVEVTAPHKTNTFAQTEFGCAYGRVAPTGLQNLPRNIEEHYYLGQIIGTGAYGTVRYAVNKHSMQECAVKVLPKERGNVHVSTTLRKIEREIQLHQKVQECANVIRLLDAFQDDSCVYLVLELCKGGSLEAHLQAHGPLSENLAAVMLYECLKVVASCHANGILHGDVKPANFVFAHKASDTASDALLGGGGSWVKALDFGCSQRFTGQALRTRVGTPVYMAPEVFLRQYGLSADMWSVGILMYQLLSGRFPFWDSVEDCKTQTLDEVMKAVIVDEIPFNFGPWTNLSKNGMDLILSLLNRDPNQRITAAQALEHPWFKERLPFVAKEPMVLNNILSFESSTSGALNSSKSFGLVSA